MSSLPTSAFLFLYFTYNVITNKKKAIILLHTALAEEDSGMCFVFMHPIHQAPTLASLQSRVAEYH